MSQRVTAPLKERAGRGCPALAPRISCVLGRLEKLLCVSTVSFSHFNERQAKTASRERRWLVTVKADGGRAGGQFSVEELLLTQQNGSASDRNAAVSVTAGLLQQLPHPLHRSRGDPGPLKSEKPLSIKESMHPAHLMHLRWQLATWRAGFGRILRLSGNR